MPNSTHQRMANATVHLELQHWTEEERRAIVAALTQESGMATRERLHLTLPNAQLRTSPELTIEHGGVVSLLLEVDILGPVAIKRQQSATQAINVVFDGAPSHESGRFVEVEDDEGRSIRVGEWIERPDGLWALRIDQLSPRRA